jgi:hypothetical protein
MQTHGNRRHAYIQEVDKPKYQTKEQCAVVYQKNIAEQSVVRNRDLNYDRRRVSQHKQKQVQQTQSVVS